MRDISVRYSLRSAVSSSGCSRSAVAVKSSMSEKKTVSFLRSVAIVTSLAPLKIALVELRRQVARELPETSARKPLARSSSPLMRRITAACRRWRPIVASPSGSVQPT